MYIDFQCIDDPTFQQWVNLLISRLIPILLHPKAPRSLHENAAVSIGRIGFMHPGMVAPLLPDFAQAWCQALFEIRDNEEKDSAFRGLCTLVRANPMGIAKVRPFRGRQSNQRLIFNAHGTESPLVL